MTTHPKHPWWQTGVIYQIYPRSFMDTTGNGVGDLAGVIKKLDYLSDTLGVDAIWLSPFYPSPMAVFGYDVADYTDVHPLFGNLSTFDDLIHQAHLRGLKVIIDIVPNHTSDQHPWFIESRSSRDNPKRDWYVWVDPKNEDNPPNNWLSVFGGAAWEFDEYTGQYYLHSFLKEQPDLNWRNQEVKNAIFDVFRFWLERGVDGFRIDVAHFIMKDPQMRDNPPNTSQELFIHKPLGEYDTQFHLYDKGHPDTHEIYRDLRKIMDDYNGDNPRVSIGEIHIFKLEEWVTYYGERLDELHLPFNFTLLGIEWNAKTIRQAVDDLESVLPDGAWPNYVLGNHDESRLATRIGELPARVAAMLLLTLRGIPTIYYGDEIGMIDVPIPTDRQQDPWGLRVPGLGRDPCRTPMQWSSKQNAGFSATSTQKLWLPLSDNYLEVNVENEQKNEESILNLYRRLLAMRSSNPVLQIGGYQSLDLDPINCFAYLRFINPQPPLLVVLNFSPNEQRLEFQNLGGGNIIISTYLDRFGKVDLNLLNLRSHEGVLIQLSNNLH